MSFTDILDSIQNVAYGFEEIIDYIVLFFTDLLLNDYVLEVLDFIEPALPYMPYITLGICLIVAFFGRRLFGLLRFLTFFVLGALIGIYMLGPIILDVMPDLPVWVIGVVTGIVAGVLAKIVYYLAIIAAAGYSAYIVAYTGMIPGVDSLTQDNWIVSAIIAAVALILVLILVKYIEMLGTAALGGYGVAMVVLNNWWDYTEISVFEDKAWLAILIFAGVVGLLGFAVQIKTRKRYA